MGLANATNNCQTLANRQGLNGTWIAMITDRNAGDLSKIIPWNWGTLRRVDGAIVASGWTDLWDGTLNNPINLTEMNTTKNANVWTGVTHFSGTAGTTNNDDVAYWNSNSVDTGRTGSSSSVTSTWIVNPALDDGGITNAFYCISDSGGAIDNTPFDVSFLKEVSYLAGARMTSNAVRIGGISSTIPIAVSGAG